MFKRVLFATPDVMVPKCDCSWSSPLRSIKVGLECCTKTSFRCFYEFTCIRLPMACAVIVVIVMLSTFIRFQLWEFAGSLLKTLPSARILEAFKLATTWGLRTQFGAVQGKLDKSAKSEMDEPREVILSRAPLLEGLVSPDQQHGKSPSLSMSTSFEHGEDRGRLHKMLDAAIASRNYEAVDDVIRKTETEIASEIAHQRQMGESRPTVSPYFTHILEQAELAKRVITVANVSKQFGAIVPVWPPLAQATSVDANKTEKDAMHMESELASNGQREQEIIGDERCGLAKFCSKRVFCCCSKALSTLQPDAAATNHGHCGLAQHFCCERVCCCFKKQTGEHESLMTSSGSSVEMTGNRNGGGTFEQISAVKDNEAPRGEWGFFLMHRDGKVRPHASA